MSDILDSIDNIDGFDNDDYEDIHLILDEDGEEISNDLQSIIDNESTMTMDEARSITETIKSTMTATYLLVVQAHEGKAYKALGYDTWESYVNQEFDFSVSRSYQLLRMNDVIKEIENVSPEGTTVKLTEAQARDIKKHLPELTEKIKEATVESTPEEASHIINDIVEEKRQQDKEDKKVTDAKEKAIEEAELDGYHKGLEAATDAFLEANDPDTPETLTDSADGDFVEVEVAGNGDEISPKDSMNLYTLISLITSVDSLPEDPDDIVDIIPESQSEDMLIKANHTLTWLNRFVNLMEHKKDFS